MTVSELTVKDADALLRKMYYKNDYIVDVHGYEYETKHWEELLISMTRWDADSGKIVYREKGETIDGIHVTCVEDFGGEGQGDRRWVVLSFTDSTGTKYFRKDGYYASYDGSTWDGDFREVVPQERTVTFYE